MALLCFAFPMLSFPFVFLFYSALSFQDDGQSLLAFKKLITMDPHRSLDNWISAVPLCNWTAVTCSRLHIDRVVSINLTTMNLGGTISPCLGNLTFLRSLDLSRNRLYGQFPTQLGRLSRLRNLWLHKNQLEGNIPSDLGNCTNLASLVLYDNNLTGKIPHELGSLTHLQVLNLAMNNLKGTISSSFINSSALYFRNYKYHLISAGVNFQVTFLFSC